MRRMGDGIIREIGRCPTAAAMASVHCTSVLGQGDSSV